MGEKAGIWSRRMARERVSAGIYGSGVWREGDFNLAGTSASTRLEDETLAHKNREHRTLAGDFGREGVEGEEAVALGGVREVTGFGGDLGGDVGTVEERR